MTRFLLEWVVTASLLILAVIGLRALLGRRISAGLRYALWAAALVRLLVPLQFFSLPVPAVLPEVDREPAVTGVTPAATVPVHQGAAVGVPAIAAPLPSGAVVNYDTAAPSDVTLEVMSLWDVLGWLWLAGSLVMAAAFLSSNLTFALRLRRVRTPLEGTDCPLPVYLAENLPSPCLFGLVRPAVYVTADAAQDPSMLRHILAHEYTHFRHRDHVWNVVRSAALTIHWWNPLVWLAVVCSRRDGELACDEGALKRLGDGERIAYGRTLLALITVKPRPGDLLRCSTTMTGGQKSIFDRVTRIARSPKRWLWAAVVAVIVASLACVCAFGAAEETGDGAKPDFALSIAPLESELNFSIDEDGNVVITGTIDGLTLEAGTYWQSAGAPAHTLMMPYTPFDDNNADGYLQAQWNGDNTVLIWSQIMTTPSNDPNAGFWTFSVDLSREQAVVTDMASLPSSPAKTDSDTKLHLYPESISDEEAVRAARIAAKLMTEAEDYYNNHTGDMSSPSADPTPTQPVVPVLDPDSYTFIMDEYGISLDIIGLDCEYARWTASRTDHNNGGMLEPSLDISKPRFLGEEFADVYSSVSVRCGPEGDGQLWIDAIENNPGTLGSREFLVDLTTGAVTEQEVSISEWKGKLPAPPDQVLVGAAQILARLMGEASEFYQASLPAPEEGPLPFDTPMKLMFCSGAGAWDTLITLHPDGSCEGDYHDMDMGDSGPGYQSTEYVCRFHGRFGEIRQVTGASWSLTLAELVLDTGHPIGEEWIEAMETSDGYTYHLRYISSAPYGFSKRDSEGYSIPLEPGAQFMFYTPDASGYRPTDELYGFNYANKDWDSVIYQFWTWMPSGRKIGAWGWDTKLGCYALCNMETGYGFYDLKAWGIA